MHEEGKYLCTWQCCPSVRGTWWTSASLQGWCPLAVIVDTVDCFQPPADGAETIKQEIEDNSTCKSTTKSSLIFCIFPCYQESPTSWIIHFSVGFILHSSEKVILCKSSATLWSISKVTRITNVLVNNHNTSLKSVNILSLHQRDILIKN